MVRNTEGGKIAFYQAWTDDNLLIFEYCGRVQAFRVIPDGKYIIAIEGGTIRADHGAKGLIETLEAMPAADLEKIIKKKNILKHKPGIPPGYSCTRSGVPAGSNPVAGFSVH